MIGTVKSADQTGVRKVRSASARPTKPAACRTRHASCVDYLAQAGRSKCFEIKVEKEQL